MTRGGRVRLDAELVRRGLARSREHASDLVAEGRVAVGGRPAGRRATAVPRDAPIAVAAAGAAAPEGSGTAAAAAAYASRGGAKLAGALDALAADGAPVAVAGRRCLDAGASTGGFTDVLLRRGAAEVVAVDVGTGQLVPRLRGHPRVRAHERTNVRDLTAERICGPVDLVVADLSFISLVLVLPALAGCVRPGGDLLLLVKPQFEVGRGRVGRGGVVRDPALRAEAVRGVAVAAGRLGLGPLRVVASPLPGPAGTLEYFLWLRRGAPALPDADLAALVEPAVAAGPGSPP